MQKILLTGPLQRVGLHRETCRNVIGFYNAAIRKSYDLVCPIVLEAFKHRHRRWYTQTLF